MRIGIIGGGAAGLFTACQLKRLASDAGNQITVIEKKHIPGIKLTLTGHGRCNITNRKDINELKKGYHEAEKFLYPALKEFGPEDTIAFFENELGLKTKEEDNNRIFPVCDSAVTVRDTLLEYLSGSAELICDAEVTDIGKNAQFEVMTSKGKYSFDILVLSCGGSSFKKTGSTGSSYVFAERLGHTIVPLRPALSPVKADNGALGFTKNLSGVSVKCKASLILDGKASASYTGEVLFADFGLTGPAIMELSREIPVRLTDRDASVELDLIPTLNDEQFDSELIRLIDEHPDMKISTILSGYVPASVALGLTVLSDARDLYAQGFKKENRRKLVRAAKHLRISLAGVPDMDRAYVTRGGVSLKEVDRKTMQSKAVPGLYIIGEALDVDGISGGYNLQACMSEAYLAAKDIIRQ